MDLNNLHQLCTDRRSVHSFSDVSVPTEEVLSLLRCAQLSPSVENTQPWRFHIISDTALRDTVLKASYYGAFEPGASTLIVVTCDSKAELPAAEVLWNPKELEYSCAASMSTILLAATAHKLGSCWVSLFAGKVHDALKLPLNELPVGGILIGHPVNEEGSEVVHEREALESVVKVHGEKL